MSRQMDYCRCGSPWLSYRYQKTEDVISVQCVACQQTFAKRPVLDTKPWVWSGSKRAEASR